MNRRSIVLLPILLVLILSASCTSNPATPVYITLPTKTAEPTSVSPASASIGNQPLAASTEVIPVTGHTMRPADAAPAPGAPVYDVTSSRRSAPYGDSYKINLFERPFLNNMKYVPDLDIVSFRMSEDVDWYYISIDLKGEDPNNPLGIHYGAEIDLNADGFGDLLIWAGPPYTAEWSTATVQVFQDSDHDSAGRSSNQSDAVFDGNGYETLIYDGAANQGSDSDLAWVRMGGVPGERIQFAFKKALTGPVFLLGVVADAGLKDVSRFDYNDYFKEAEAGSPVRGATYYPLGAIFAVDNTCWAPIGTRHLEGVPKLCPPATGATATNRPRESLSITDTPVPPPASTRPPSTVPPTQPPPTSAPTEPSPPPLPTVVIPTTAVPPPTQPTDPPAPQPTAVSSCNPLPPCPNYNPVKCTCPGKDD